jgi:hypothetical protein
MEMNFAMGLAKWLGLENGEPRRANRRLEHAVCGGYCFLHQAAFERKK